MDRRTTSRDLTHRLKIFHRRVASHRNGEQSARMSCNKGKAIREFRLIGMSFVDARFYFVVNSFPCALYCEDRGPGFGGSLVDAPNTRTLTTRVRLGGGRRNGEI
jgi:hypothetical protein